MSDQPPAKRGSHRVPVLTGLGVAVLGVAVAALGPAGQALASSNVTPASPAPQPAPVAPAARAAPAAPPPATPFGPIPGTPIPTPSSSPAPTVPLPAIGTPYGSTILTTTVGPAIALIDNTASFTLDGNIGDQPVATRAVSLTVLTNNSGGYSVSVTPVTPVTAGLWSIGDKPTDTLVALPDPTTNHDTIPVGDISVEETPNVPLNGGASGNSAFQQLTPQGVQVYNQTVASVAGGDGLTNDYEYSSPIPAVAPDTYWVQLDYVATATGFGT
jgi:hypothetical protein